MAANSIPVTHGVANGVTIVSNPDAGTWGRVYVTLSSAYARVIPPGYPDPNPGVGLATSQTATPKTIANGTRVLLFQHEAAALVAAAVAAYS